MKLFHVSFAVLLVALAGCGAHDEYMPLKPNETWTYQVSTAFDRQVAPITVTRELTVASANGYELSGPLGQSRIAWKGNVLVADSMANAVFDPPIPLLNSNVELAKDHPVQVGRAWEGLLISNGQENPARAVLTEQPDTVDLGVRRASTILATLTVTFSKTERVIELKSWYESGVGLVQQEQRTGAEIDSAKRVVQLVLVRHT